jgi:hypothetical protein
MQNARGQGISHATGDSKVPEGIQNKASKGVEESLPNKVCLAMFHRCISQGLNTNNAPKVHDTGSGTGRQTHALNEGEDSVFPKSVQKAVPESVEHKLPNKLHNTGD